MTRGHTPPSTLTSEDILALGEVRRDIWTNGLYGFLGGGATAYVLHRGALFARDRKVISASLNRNTAFASVMLGAALGSFLLSTTTGKNSVHNLHPIFERGAQPVAVGKNREEDKEYSYQRSRARATTGRNEELERNQLVRKNSAYGAQFGGEDPDEKVNRLELERNRIMRRASLTRNLKEGQGLNDSHGGHWVEDKFNKG